MSLKQIREWRVSCDAQGCTNAFVLGTTVDLEDRWDAGRAANDARWSAGPNRDETYCPEHDPSTIRDVQPPKET